MDSTSSVPILMYHEISDKTHPWCVSFKNFKQQMLHLKQQGYQAITLDALRGPVPEKSVVITFDDGRKGVHSVLPLMKDLGFTAMVYVVPSWVDGKIPEQENFSEFLDWVEIKELVNAGWVIGSHTWSHKNLTKVDESTLKHELVRSIVDIEKHAGVKVNHFSYPYGKFNEKVQQEVNQRFSTAVSVVRGFSKEPYARQWVMNDTTLRDFQQLLRKPTLSLCMIVKNEEKNLAKCLESVKDLVDEIIIVDTGSTDKTKKIAAKYTHQVFDFSWMDDFAAARNFSLSKTNCDWILVLDADEVLDPANLVILEAINDPSIQSYRILTKNYTDDSTISGWQPGDGKGWVPSLKIRLFRKGQEFTGKIHEMVLEKGGVAVLPVVVHHYGNYSKEKTAKYMELTKKKINDKPDAQAYFELGVQQKQLGDLVAAEKSFKHSLVFKEEVLPRLNLGIVQQKQGKLAQAIENFTKLLTIKSHPEAYFNLGFCYFKQGNLIKSIENFNASIKLRPSYVDAYVNLGAIYERQEKYPFALTVLKRALQIAPKHARAWHNLGVVQEKQQNLEGALKSYREALRNGYSEQLKGRVEKIELFIQKNT